MRPLITLLTDFGLRDSYVAEMKAAIYSRCPEANVVDITHEIPPQNITAGGLQLERAIRAFPAGTIHVAVVDPGVGTNRRLLCCEVNGQTVLLPDNGLISWTHFRLGPVQANELRWRPAQSSSTFHGRDILAPVAAMIATETIPESVLGTSIGFFLQGPKPATSFAEAVVIDVDHFGNVVTNVPGELARQGDRVNDSIKIAATYGYVAPQQPVALVGSSGLLEIAINGGNASHSLNLNIGDKITIA